MGLTTGNNIQSIIRLIPCLLICFMLFGLSHANAQTGSISGHVYESDGLTPIAAIVLAYESCDGGLLKFTYTDDAGAYTLTDLPAGNVYVAAGGTEYVAQWYNGEDICLDSEFITVTDGLNTGNIDFQLIKRGSISGKVLDKDGMPITSFRLDAMYGEYDDDEDSSWAWTSVTFENESGEYTLYLDPEDYYVRVSNVSGYIPSWYNNISFFWGCTTPPVNVSSGINTGDINFQLEEGGYIQGAVYKSDGVTPISGISVTAYSTLCDTSWTGSTVLDRVYTNIYGGYFINVPAGNVYVVAAVDSPCKEPDSYIPEWYNNKLDCNAATSVAVTVGSGTNGIDFELLESETDTDVDGMPDGWEINYFGDLSRDGTGNYDNDGLNDLQEYQNMTNPKDADSDDDGLTDGDEVNSQNTSPILDDTDSDGMPDGWEVQYKYCLLNPVVNDASSDPDGDGFTNLQEYQKETDPCDQDSHPTIAMPWLPLILE